MVHDWPLFRVEAQTIFMSISFIDILRITPAANTSDIICGASFEGQAEYLKIKGGQLQIYC